MQLSSVKIQTPEHPSSLSVSKKVLRQVLATRLLEAHGCNQLQQYTIHPVCRYEGDYEAPAVHA
jgi:hypothetical protein